MNLPLPKIYGRGECGARERRDGRVRGERRKRAEGRRERERE